MNDDDDDDDIIISLFLSFDIVKSCERNEKRKKSKSKNVKCFK